MDRNDFWLVSYAALLHDIGKLYGRVNKKSHPLYVTDYINLTKSSIEKLGFDIEKLEKISRHHHENPKLPKEALVSTLKNDKLRFYAKIVSTADNFSSSERYEDETETAVSYEGAFLESIFSYVSLDEVGAYPPNRFLYLPDRLDREIQVKKVSKARIKISWNQYLQDFLKTVKRIEVNSAGEEEFLRSAYFNTLLSIFKLFLWAVPADVRRRKDISLYDHLKSTSAIASALFQWFQENSQFKDNYAELEKLVSEDKEKRFLLIGGDIGGIQKYITGFKNVGGGTARRLRGRSFYVLALGTALSHYIVKKLGLTSASIIYSSGGKFIILGANTEKTQQKLNEIKRQIEEWLLEAHGGRLPVYLSWVKVSGSDLGLAEKGKDNIFTKLEERLRLEKSKPFERILKNGEKWLPHRFILGGEWQNGEYCQVCELKPGIPNDDGIRICRSCTDEAKIGSMLLKAKYFGVCEGEASYESFTLLGNLKIFFTDKLSYTDRDFFITNFDDSAFEELLDSKSKIPSGFVFSFLPYYAPIVSSERESARELKTFEQIAEESEGDKKLGVFKADVDKLGIIVSSGIPNLSVSRLSTFSFMLDYFFSWRIKQKIKSKNDYRDIYIIYAGGDDLFFIGPWDKSLKFAVEINKEFLNWTGNNPNIRISGGYCVVTDHLPVYAFAEEVERELKRAKEKGGSLSIFENVREFGDFDEIIKLSEKVSRAFETQQLKRTHLQKLTEIYLEWKEIKEKEGLPLFAPHLAYVLARNMEGIYELGKGKIDLGAFASLLEKGTKPSQADEVIPKIGIIAQLAKLLTRSPEKSIENKN